MKYIKEKYTSKKQVLFINNDNQLYLYGYKAHDILGIVVKKLPDNEITGPFYTGITLDKDDNIKKFYYRDFYIIIYTEKGKLYFSRSIISKNYIPFIKGKNNNKSENNSESDSKSENNESNIFIDLDSSSEDDNNNDDENNDDDDDDTSDSEQYYDFFYYKHLPNLEFDVENENKLKLLKNYSDQEINDFKEMKIDMKLNNENDDNINVEYNFAYRNCVDLFGENVKNVTLIGKYLFFNIGKKIFIFNPLNSDSCCIESIFLSMRPLLVQKNKIIGDIRYTYHQVIFPFNIDNIFFCENFIYFVSNKYHNVLLNKITPEGIKIEWIHFITEINFTVSDLYILNEESDIFIKCGIIVYKYYQKTKNLEKFLEHENVYFEKNDKGKEIILCKINESVYSYQYNSCILKNIYQGKYFKEVQDVLDISTEEPQNVVLIRGNEKKLMFIEDKQFYLNVDKIICYGHKIYRYVVFCSENKIYFICSNVISKKNKGNLKLYKRFHTKNKVCTYHVYFYELPFTVTNVTINNEIILFKSSEKYYYLELDAKPNFLEIKFDIDLRCFDDLIVKSIVKREIVDDYDDFISLKIDSNSKRISELDKMLVLAESVKKYTDIGLTYVNGDNVGSGDGCKIQFMNNALKLFKNKYLIEFGSRTKFNIDELSIFTDNELTYIGSMLHMIMYHTRNNLSIRLPITLLTAILKRSPTIEELEFFASKEFKSVFNKIYESKDNIEYIQSLGFETYYDCLRNMCGYYNDDQQINNQVKHISRKIADGFMEFDIIINLRIMNLPTLDYYISGDYSLDRNKLIKNLNITFNGSKSKKYKKMMENIIKDLPEEKLVILLENWSSNNIIQNNEYNVHIYKSKCDIKFMTCNTELHINNDMLLLENKDLFTELLTSPINSFKD
ncbi:putative kilA-n domain protein [Saudi moumouvirus]|nr:putative kilA-n domain protein [Saudi moumouvirus]